MHLIPFTEQDYPLLVSWIPNEEFNFLWGGPLFEWPLTADQIGHHQKLGEVNSFILLSEGEKIGFIELIKESSQESRLCRVLVAAQLARGRGYGRKLVQLAIEYAQNELGAERVTLVVFENNEPAIKCYNSLGFQLTTREEKSRKFCGQWWPLLRMELIL